MCQECGHLAEAHDDGFGCTYPGCRCIHDHRHGDDWLVDS